MPQIEITINDLTLRMKSAKNLLKPIADSFSSVMSVNRSYNGYLAIGAYSGGAVGIPASWRVKCEKGIYVNYYELWQEFGQKGNYFLSTVCLNFYRLDGFSGTEEELFMIHADPDWLSTRPHGVYKKGPHLHVISGDWAHVHIGLNVGHLSQVLKSPSSLSLALASGVDLVANQILPVL